MSLKLKILIISMAVLLVILGGIGAYGYYTGKFLSSADELEKARQIDENSKAAKYTSCSNGVCLGIDDYLDQVEPGKRILVKAWVTVPAGKKLEVNRGSNGGYFSTWFYVGDRAYLPTNASDIIFPDGRTEFNMYITLPSNPTWEGIYETISLSGRLVEACAYPYGSHSTVNFCYGYGYGYGYNTPKNIYLHAEHSTPFIFPKPNLISNKPANDAINVPLNTKVSATLDQPLNPSLTKMLVAKASLEDEGTISYENDNKTIVLTPKTPLTPDTKYVVNVRANGENNLFTWTFTTAKTQPPVVKINSPADGTTTTAANITVTGTVTDSDTPFNQLQVKVNNVTTSIASNGTYSAKVNLQTGKNTITVAATDLNNGSDSKTITVTRQGTGCQR